LQSRGHRRRRALLGRGFGPAGRSRSSGDPRQLPHAGEVDVQIQRVEHESRVHLDIETDDIPAEVARLEKLGAVVDKRLERWVVMRAPSGQRFCVVRVQRDGWPKGATEWA
jgi:hypothetical protein